MKKLVLNLIFIVLLCTTTDVFAGYIKSADSFHHIYAEGGKFPNGMDIARKIEIPYYTRMIKPNTVAYNSVGITKELIQ